ncbi:unnamed protein product [Haemonchus placei]|uniref:SET domain-containing protein n=1 Tax=Haemonchus placei TaxID=6290 RepID=A0A0N4WTN3_HAEPC|nr:unnamed protein product [Haemonchus placei]
MLAPQYRRSVTDCYDRHRPNMPNTARPPPSMKTDNSDNTFHASLSMLENPTQNSAAAYTASWVSSTSSIPPELRDEPERDDLAAGASAVFTPPVSTFADQFSNISITEKDGELLTTQWENPTILAAQQWPGLGQDGGGGGASVGQERRRRADERQLHARESSKELTWEERIRKGAVQKERVEQRGLERPERTERDGRENNSGNVRHKGQRGGRYGVPSRSDRLGRETILSPILGDRDDYPCRNGQTIRSTRGNRTVERTIHHDIGARIVPMRVPQYYSHGVPLFMARGAYYRAGPPPVVCIPQQDQRFRNTWLDASLGINYPSVQMVDYSYTPCCGVYRTRPTSGGRSGCRYASNNLCKENVNAQCNEQTSIETDQSRRAQSAVENNDLSKADEEDWDAEIKEQKRSRWPRNSGHGTIPSGDNLMASVSGVKMQYSRMYIPKIGGVVVGRIAGIQRARWKVFDSDVLDEVAMSKHLVVGDMLSAEVQQIRTRGQLQLHTRNINMVLPLDKRKVLVRIAACMRMLAKNLIAMCDVTLMSAYSVTLTDKVKDMARPEISSVLVPRITDLIAAEEKRRALEKDRAEAARK